MFKNTIELTTSKAEYIVLPSNEENDTKHFPKKNIVSIIFIYSLIVSAVLFVLWANCEDVDYCDSRYKNNVFINVSDKYDILIGDQTCITYCLASSEYGFCKYNIFEDQSYLVSEKKAQTECKNHSVVGYQKSKVCSSEKMCVDKTFFVKHVFFILSAHIICCVACLAIIVLNNKY